MIDILDRTMAKIKEQESRIIGLEKESKALKAELRENDKLIADLRYRVRDLEYLLKKKSEWDELDDGKC